MWVRRLTFFVRTLTKNVSVLNTRRHRRRKDITCATEKFTEGKIFKAVQVLDRFLRLLIRGQRKWAPATVIEQELKPKENLYERPEDFLSLQTVSSVFEIE